jgi:choline dehydrogenase-like flavoprotein
MPSQPFTATAGFWSRGAIWYKINQHQKRGGNSGDMAEDIEFDYVVVGAGSAGCVLASRLSEDGKSTVCLIEAGPKDRNPLIHIPACIVLLMRHKHLNWGFSTTPQDEMNGARVSVPRGRALGGSSSINGMVYIRGHRGDYDDWAAAGNPGWGWDDVMPYFLKSENNRSFPESEYHGKGGPLNVTFVDRPSKLHASLAEAAEQLQYRVVEDFNGAEQDGYGIHQVTQKNGRRWSAAAAYLTPARKRHNLEVITGEQVARVTLDGLRATGVEMVRDGRRRKISARREVILSAGAIGSPQILMLSGIGDGAALAKHGIAVNHELAAVGRNLQDHVSARIEIDSKSVTPYGISLRAAPKIAWSVLEYLALRRGLWSSNLVEGGGFIRTEPGLERPDIQHVFVPAKRGVNGALLGWGHGYGLNAVLLRPKSRGEIRLASADPGAAPEIDPRFFSDPADLPVLLRGLRAARRLLSAPAFERYRGVEIWPGLEYDDDEALSGWIRQNASTIFHPVGTCRMGGDADAVVDPQLRVRGIDGLRVADASIMPEIVGGNTNAPVIMIGEKAADMIRQGG